MRSRIDQSRGQVTGESISKAEIPESDLNLEQRQSRLQDATSRQSHIPSLSFAKVQSISL